MPATAIVMNLSYTGLGIARSLGERGVPVIGLTAQRRTYGNFTRYAHTVFGPDSRSEPEALLAHLLLLGNQLGHRSVIFPTRDDDLEFLDRFRDDLALHFSLVIPERSVLTACMNKWETYRWAQQAGTATPKSWLVEGEPDLRRIITAIPFPCVLKPVSSLHWRQGCNWEIVGARKAISISSRARLLAEYGAVARADKRVLLQELVTGSDDSLFAVACYFDRQSNCVASFSAQKLIQCPEGFGTGCIVQSTDRFELLDPTIRLLQAMRFTGIAEVEYKWDAVDRKFKLIEINPRPWDQHRLGNSCGVDLIYLAYCEHAGLARPIMIKVESGHKWIADDTFITTVLSFLWKGDPKCRSFFRLARGKRTFAICSARDPLPFVGYFAMQFVPRLISSAVRIIWSALRSKMPGKMTEQKDGSDI